MNDVVAYFHENPNIASTRRAYKYFREALAYESAQELSDVKNISHNENADVFALCQSKELFRLKTKKFLLNRDNKRGRFVKCAIRKINQKNIMIKKHQTSVTNAQSSFAKNPCRFTTLRVIFEIKFFLNL